MAYIDLYMLEQLSWHGPWNNRFLSGVVYSNEMESSLYTLIWMTVLMQGKIFIWSRGTITSAYNLQMSQQKPFALLKIQWWVNFILYICSDYIFYWRKLKKILPPTCFSDPWTRAKGRGGWFCRGRFHVGQTSA